MRRVRQRTVEPVFGNLLQHYGLRRVGTKGKAAAHKAMLLSAIAYNLKKLLRHQPKQVVSRALVQQLVGRQLVYRFFVRARRKFTSSIRMPLGERPSSATDTHLLKMSFLPLPYSSSLLEGLCTERYFCCASQRNG